MAESNWPACYAATRQYEGGNDDDKRDPGGRTSRGILQREWTPYVAEHPSEGLPADVWKAPESAITDIYKNDYWDAVQGNYWPTGCDLAVWDAGVNSGVARSKVWAASCLNGSTWLGLATSASALPDKTTFIHAFYGKRTSFLHGLKTFATFGHGWTVRCTTGEALACKMAGNSPVVLKKKATDAKKKSQNAGHSTAGTAASGGVLSQFTDHPVILGIIIAGVVAGAAYLIWKWYVNNERAKALEAAAHA